MTSMIHGRKPSLNYIKDHCKFHKGHMESISDAIDACIEIYDSRLDLRDSSTKQQLSERNSKPSNQQAPAAHYSSRPQACGRGRGRGRGCGRQQYDPRSTSRPHQQGDQDCYFCGKKSHYQKDCFHDKKVRQQFRGGHLRPANLAV